MTDSQEPPKTDMPTEEGAANAEPPLTWDDLNFDERELLRSLDGPDRLKSLKILVGLFDKKQRDGESDDDYEYRTRFYTRPDEPKPYDLKSGLVYTTNPDDIPQELWGHFSGYAAVGNRTDNFCAAIAIYARLIQTWQLHINFADPQWAERFKTITLDIQNILNRAPGS